MPNPVQQSMSLTMRLCVCSRLWVMFIGHSHCSGAPGHIIPGGAPGILPRGGSKPSCLQLPEFIPQHEVPTDLLPGTPGQSEGKHARFTVETVPYPLHQEMSLVPALPLLLWVT